MSQLTKVAKHLRRNTTGPGITPGRLAFLAGIPKDAVYRRVSDLRVLEGREIYSNYRTVNGVKHRYPDEYDKHQVNFNIDLCRLSFHLTLR